MHRLHKPDCQDLASISSPNNLNVVRLLWGSSGYIGDTGYIFYHQSLKISIFQVAVLGDHYFLLSHLFTAVQLYNVLCWKTADCVTCSYRLRLISFRLSDLNFF